MANLPIRIVPGEKLPLSADPTYAELLRQIGGVRGLKDLALYSSRAEAKKLLALCSDPSFKQCGGKKLAQLANLSFKDLLEMRNERAMMLAVSNVVVEHVGEILEGAAQDAKPSFETCPKCDGLGELTVKDATDKCPKCRGVGTVRVKADYEARKFVGEVTGLIKSGGQTINVNAQAQAGIQFNNPHGSFEDLMKKAGQAITVQKIGAIDV